MNHNKGKTKVSRMVLGRIKNVPDSHIECNLTGCKVFEFINLISVLWILTSPARVEILNVLIMAYNEDTKVYDGRKLPYLLKYLKNKHRTEGVRYHLQVLVQNEFAHKISDPDDMHGKLFIISDKAIFWLKAFSEIIKIGIRPMGFSGDEQII